MFCSKVTASFDEEKEKVHIPKITKLFLKIGFCVANLSSLVQRETVCTEGKTVKLGMRVFIYWVVVLVFLFVCSFSFFIWMKAFYVVLDVLEPGWPWTLAQRQPSTLSFWVLGLNSCFTPAFVFKHKCSWMWWHIPVIPITQEVELLP